MRLITGLIFMVTFNISNAQNISEENIRRFVDLELKNYPKATLIDLYKNYFQDAFGPGHLIPDTTQAGKYLDWELAQTNYTDTTLIQPPGIQNDYYRVNLLLIKNGTIPRDTLLLAMVESATLARKPEIKQFIAEWNNVCSFTKQYKPHLHDFKKSSKQINSNLSKGEVVSHHSKLFEDAYHPHYRIIHKSVIVRWETEFKL